MVAKKKPKKPQKFASAIQATPFLVEPMPGKTRVGNVSVLRRYPEVRRLYIKHLARYGNIRAACAYVNVSFEVMDTFRRHHPWFSAEIDVAITAHKTLIEETIHERAIDGWLEPKFGKFGVQGYVRKYSDQLLVAYARRHVPEYRQGEENTTTVTGMVDHVHSVHPKELTPEQRQALRLLLGTPEDQPEGVVIPKITMEPSTNGAHSTNGNGKH